MLNNRPSTIKTWQNKKQNEQQNFQNNFSYEKKDNQSNIQNSENYFEFQLVDADKFLITGPFKAFTDQKKQIIKQFGAKWQPKEKGWIADISNKKEISQKLKEEDKEIQIKDIPNIALKSIIPIKDILNIIQGANTLKIIKYSANTRLKSLNDLPQSIQSRLYDFQKTCIEFGLKNMGRILIADEMGVGKTIESLSLSFCYREEWPLLIVCPSSLRLNWKDEVLNWIPDIQNDQIQVISKGNQEIFNQTLVIIISYDMSLKYIKEFNQLNINIAIVDEAHYLKNPQAKRTELLTPILCRCNHIFLLTGTPAFAKPKELFSLLSIIRPDIFYSFREFGARYCDPKPSRFHKGIDYEGSSNSQELYFILKKNIMIRRLKRDVLKELPAKRRQRITIPSDSKYVKEITAILNKCGQNNLDGLFNQMMLQAVISRKQNQNGNQQTETEVEFNPQEDQMKIFEAFNQCYILTGKAKIKGIQDYISELMENDIKFIIFAHHIEILDELEKFVQIRKVESIRIDGSIPFEKRHERIKQFQTNLTVKVAIIALTSGGIGINLTACSNIIFAEMHWTPAVMLQAEDRAHRIGQENCVNCHYLIGENTLDEKLFSKLESKFRVVSNFLDGSFRELDAEQLYNQMGNIEQQTNETSKQKDNQKLKIKQKRQEKIEKQNLKEQKKNTAGMKSIDRYFVQNPKPQKNIRKDDYEEKEIEYMNSNIYLNETPLKNIELEYQQMEKLNNSDIFQSEQSDEIDNILEVMRLQEKQTSEQIEERKILNQETIFMPRDLKPIKQITVQKDNDVNQMKNIRQNHKNKQNKQQNLKNEETNKQEYVQINQQNTINLKNKQNNQYNLDQNDEKILNNNKNKYQNQEKILNNNKNKNDNNTITNNDKMKQINPINITNQQKQFNRIQNQQQIINQNRNQNQNQKTHQKQKIFKQKNDFIIIDDDQMSSNSISKQEQFINIDNNKLKSVHLQQGLKAYITQRGERIIVSDSGDNYSDDIINVSDDMIKKRKLNDQNQLKLKQN